MSRKRPPSLRERVAEQLRAELLRGNLRPGVTYTVRSMAAQFGVSPTPFREAILDLSYEGLLTVKPNKGFSVIEPDAATVIHIANVRRLLEIPGTIEAARHVTEEDVAHLLESAERTAFFAQRGDIAGYVGADMDFHRDVLVLSRNPLLVDLSERLRAQARSHAFPALLHDGNLAASAQEHVDLVRSMEAADAAGIRALVEQHINYAIMALTLMEPVAEK